jgi:hypothetical protein
MLNMFAAIRPERGMNLRTDFFLVWLKAKLSTTISSGPDLSVAASRSMKSAESCAMPSRPTKITFAEMRTAGVRGVLI